MQRLPPPDTTVVTGAGGWLGTALLHGFTGPDDGQHRDGRIVAVVTDESQRDAAAACSPHIDAVVADVTDPRSLDDVLAATTGVTDVIHTAGVIHPRRAAEFDAVNAGGTRNVLDAARRAGVRRLVHVSSNSPFGTNPTPRDTFGHHEPYHPYLGYGWSKMRAELAVAAAVDEGLDAVIVRPPWFYGPWQPPRQTTFFRMVRTGRFPIIGTGEQRRSMVYVEHLVQGIALAGAAAGATGQAYWIADPTPYTLSEIVATVRRALTAEGLECSPRQLRLPLAVGRVAERADRFVQARGGYQQQLHVLGELAHTIAVDVSAACDELGYDPTTTLLDGMRHSIRWCLDRGMTL